MERAYGSVHIEFHNGLQTITLNMFECVHISVQFVQVLKVRFRFRTSFAFTLVFTMCTLHGNYIPNITHLYRTYIQSKYSIFTHAKEIREHFDFSSVLNLFSFIHTPEEINYFAGDLIKKMFRISS